MSNPVSAVRRYARAAAACCFAAAALSVHSVAHADELVVSAAASLTNAFRIMATAFEKTHPNTQVVLNLGASDVLLQQILNGAPADVFASADETAMDKAVDGKAVIPNTRRDFATNSLVMIVPADSRLPVRSVREALMLPQVKHVALGNPASVPAGRYAKAFAEFVLSPQGQAILAKYGFMPPAQH